VIEFITRVLIRVVASLVDGWLLYLAYNYFQNGHIYWAAFFLAGGATGIIQTARIDQ